jgi:hypothetical protein
LILGIEPLGKRHDRAAFSSGQPDLDDWFRRRASQDERRNASSSRSTIGWASSVSTA